MAFPGPYATVYRNEAGEPIGWSDESCYEPDYEEMERDYDRHHCECGADLRKDPCVCDQYCSRCGNLSLDEAGWCFNLMCLDNLERMFPIRMGS